ncbi:MAG: ribosome maturation factor RimM [Castellaniella sp.]
MAGSPGLPSGDAPVGDALVELGRISGAHGVRGWIRIRPYSEGAPTLLATSRWMLRSPATAAGDLALVRQAEPERVRPHGDSLIARLKGLDDRDQALELKGWTISVAREDFPPLEENETYWVDLIGCRVYGESDAGDPEAHAVLIGTVRAVMDNGAHGILQVDRMRENPDGTLEPCMDAKGRLKEVLVPYVAAHVHTVDLPGRRLFSNWPVDD